MIKLICTLAIVGLIAYAGSTIKLGKRTLFGHVRAIWHTEEVQDLKDGVKEKAGPAVDKLKRGVSAGVKAMEDEGGSAGSGSGRDRGAGAPATL